MVAVLPVQGDGEFLPERQEHGKDDPRAAQRLVPELVRLAQRELNIELPHCSGGVVDVTARADACPRAASA
jgi:hypothetical protein